jgi:hypothetical protein
MQGEEPLESVPVEAAGVEPEEPFLPNVEVDPETGGAVDVVPVEGAEGVYAQADDYPARKKECLERVMIEGMLIDELFFGGASLNTILDFLNGVLKTEFIQANPNARRHLEVAIAALGGK